MPGEREIFDACFSLPAHERAAYLDRVCANDAGLRSRMERLIAAHERAENSTAGLVMAPAEFTGCGPYRVIRVLGEGGMGTVYEAEQSEPVRRRVALKVVKAGAANRQAVARFEAERQALAVMDHPYIARVFDAGTTGDGRLYFAMELVNGVPLGEFCAAHRVSLRQRLQLFVLICQAVQHAHQKGVVHRDLKPSNILVELQGTVALPKIIDFGIAKAIGERLTDASTMTVEGQTLGTPAYMSPEQVGIAALDVDTRADVYSLGVILYELLAGVLPLDPKEAPGAAFFLRVADLNVEWPAPSTRLRSDDSKAIERELKGDLDWIVLKAVEKDRERRYETPGALAEDIERYLRDEPVQARPPSAMYRARKFARRHRVGVTAAAVALFAILAGSVGTAVGLMRAREAEALARREAESAERVVEFLAGLFEVADPNESQGRSITARELLERGAARIGAGMDPRLTETLGRVHLALGMYPEALKIAQKAVQNTQKDVKNERFARSLMTFGEAQARLGQFEAARKSFEEALAIRIREHGERHPLVAESKRALGNLHWQLDHLEQARALHEEALAAFDEDDERKAAALRGLGIVLVSMEKYSEALDVYQRAQAIYERVHGENHSATADNLDSIGLVHASTGKHAEARRCHERAFEIRRRLLGEEHPVLAFSLLNLARTYSAEKRFGEALPLYDRGLRIRERALGVDHPRTADIVESMAVLHATRGDLKSAGPLFERSLAIYRKAYGDRHSETLESRRNLAIYYTLVKQKRRALEQLKQVVEDGYAEHANLADPLFDSLRTDPAFAELERRRPKPAP